MNPGSLGMRLRYGAILHFLRKRSRFKEMQKNNLSMCAVRQFLSKAVSGQERYCRKAPELLRLETAVPWSGTVVTAASS